MNAYILTYDFSKAKHINTQLISFIKMNRDILEWSSPFDGCFLFTSAIGYKELAPMFIEFFGEGPSFVISRLDVGGLSGRLPTKVWQWLTSNVRQSYHLENSAPYPPLENVEND